MSPAEENPYRSPEAQGQDRPHVTAPVSTGCAAFVTLAAWCVLGFGFGGMIQLVASIWAGPFWIDQIGPIAAMLWWALPFLGMGLGGALGGFRLRRWWLHRQAVDRQRSELEELISQHRPQAPIHARDPQSSPFADDEKPSPQR